MLPFLLIGKALKPLAKIKKKAWSAMGNAFGQIRKSVDPMKSFSKILEVVNVLMLPLTYIFTLLAMIILKELMPYIGELIIILGDLEEALHDLGDAASDAIEDLVSWVDTWYPAVEEWAESIAWIIFLIYDLKIAIESAILPLEDFIEKIEAMIDALGGGGGGGSDPIDDLFPLPPFQPPVIGSTVLGDTSTSNTNLTIDLSGAVIDDREKLVRDITEQVIIRLG